MLALQNKSSWDRCCFVTFHRTSLPAKNTNSITPVIQSHHPDHYNSLHQYFTLNWLSSLNISTMAPTHAEVWQNRGWTIISWPPLYNPPQRHLNTLFSFIKSPLLFDYICLLWILQLFHLKITVFITVQVEQLFAVRMVKPSTVPYSISPNPFFIKLICCHI